MTTFLARSGAYALGLFLVGGLSAGMAAISSTSAMAAAGTHPVAPVTTVRVGEPIRPALRLKFGAGVWRTVEQANAWQAAHPMVGLRQAAHRPLIPMGEAAYRLAKKLAAQAGGAKPVPSVAPAAPPPTAPTKLYSKTTGPAETDPGNSGYPPDMSAAVSTNQIVVTVNNTFNVYSRTRHALLNQTLQAKFGTVAQVTEARVLYDSVWKRWIVFSTVIPDAGQSPSVFISISRSPNALGAFCSYQSHLYVTGDNLDYPMVGMSQNAVFFTMNHFSGGSFVSANMFPVSKDRLYNCLGFSVPLYGAAAAAGTLAPPVVGDTTPVAYFLAADSGTSIDLYEGDNLTTNAATFTLKTQIPVTYTVPPDAAQQNTTEKLDTLDARFQNPSSEYLDGGSGHTVLWNVHTRTLGSYPVVHFFQIDATAGTLVQEGSFYQSFTSYDFNAAIVANTSGEAFVTWTATDPGNHRNAQILYTGRQSSDPLGSMGARLALISNGFSVTGNPETPGIQYWGQYPGIALDPVAPPACSYTGNRRALFINEYGKSRTAWATEFAIAGYC